MKAREGELKVDGKRYGGEVEWTDRLKESQSESESRAASLGGSGRRDRPTGLERERWALTAERRSKRPRQCVLPGLPDQRLVRVCCCWLLLLP
jgi:hypothetical protein